MDPRPTTSFDCDPGYNLRQASRVRPYPVGPFSYLLSINFSPAILRGFFFCLDRVEVW